MHIHNHCKIIIDGNPLTNADNFSVIKQRFCSRYMQRLLSWNVKSLF